MIDIEGIHITISGLEIDDPVLADLLRDVDESDRPDIFADVVEVGARVLQRYQDGAAGDLVRHELERLKSLVALEMEAFRQQSSQQDETVTQAIVEGVQGVMNQIAMHLSRIEGTLASAGALKDERERGTAKGRIFEEQVVAVIDELSSRKGDMCEATGDLRGEGGGRAGDAVVHIGAGEGPSRGRIVFEAKTGRLSRGEMIRELDRAKQDRNADFSILVVEGFEKIPASTHWLREINGDKLVVPYDEEMGSLALETGYCLARSRVLLDREGTVEGVDGTAIAEASERALQALEDLRRIKNVMTTAKTQIDSAAEIIDTMVSTVRGHLDHIHDLSQGAT